MVQQSLVEYIQRLLAQGYDAGVIRTTLLNAGYSPYDVDLAMRVAGGGQAKKFDTRILVVAFAVLLILAGGVILALKLSQAPPAVLSFSIDLLSSEVGVGQQVVINADIKNPSGTKTSGLIDYVIEGAAGRVAAKTESFSVTTQTSVPTAVALPASIKVGSYTVKATLSYLGKSVSQSVSFEVVEAAQKAPGELETKTEEKARESQLACPGGCDDLNFCTSDTCVQGECISVPIVPCCGDAKCDSGENCQLDCAERPIGPDEISAQAKALAVSDLSKAVDVCNSMAQRAFIDICLVEVAEAGNDKGVCVAIVDSELRDACYITFAYQKDFSVCADITNPYTKNSCVSLGEIYKTQP